MSNIFWILMPFVFMGQDSVASVPKKAMVMAQFTTMDGLPDNTAYAIFQDDTGYLWVATQKGVACFDGQSFRVYQASPENPNAIPKDFTTFGFQDQKKRHWFFNLGLVLFDYRTQTFRTVASEIGNPHHFPEDSFTAITETASGKFWVGSRESVYFFDPDREEIIRPDWVNKNPREPLPTSAHKMLSDQGEGAWFLASNQLIHIREETTQPQSFQIEAFEIPGGSNNHSGTFAYLDDSHLLISTLQGYFLFSRKTHTFKPFHLETNSSYPQSEKLATEIWVRHSEEIWVGTILGLFVNKFTGSKWETTQVVPLDRRMEYPSGIFRIQPDRNGNVWVSGDDQGLYMIQPDGKKFESFAILPDDPQDLSSLDVHSIQTQDNGRVLVGTQKGLFEVEVWTKAAHSLSMKTARKVLFKNKKIFATTQDRTGRNWVATSNGLFWLTKENTVEKSFVTPTSDGSGPHSLNIRALFEDSKGNMWLGYNGAGLGRWSAEDGRFSHWIQSEDANSISNQYVNCFIEDEQGRLWVGTSKGLNLFQATTGNFKRFQTIEGDPSTIPTDFVLCLYKDSSNGIWIGTQAGGLIHQSEPGRFSIYSTAHGLPDSSINSILEDGLGNLWLSTNRGICTFNPATREVTNYTISDGLISMTFNSGAHHQSRDGRLFFGSDNGMSVTDPGTEGFGEMARPPDVVIKNLKVNQKPARVNYPGLDEERFFPIPGALETIETLNLTHDQASFSLSYTALQFEFSDQTRYAYQLEGLHEDWIYPEPELTTVTFTKLDPGRYTFRVKATNLQGVWSSQEKSLTIRILPPFWRTAWAYGFYILCLLALIYLIARHLRRKLVREQERVKQLIRFNQMKDVFLTNTSHELRNPLQGMIGLAETIKNQPHCPTDIHASLHHIVACGNRLAKLIHGILDYSQLTHHQIQLQRKPVNIHSMTEAVLALSEPLSQHKDLQIKNRVSADLPNVVADEDRLFQILHNLVGNAQKYTEAGFIYVDASTKDAQLLISVTDTGMGIPAEDLDRIFLPNEQVLTDEHANLGGIGMGLPITKELLRLHDTSLEVESTLGKGSTFYFVLPLASENFHLSQTLDEVPLLKDNSSPIVQLPLPIPPKHLKQENQVRILVVDDDPLNVNILIQHMQAFGCYAHPATSGQEALEIMATDEPFDLVLLDFMMPGLTGLDVSRKIRETWSRQVLPIIILTGKSQQNDLINAYEEGVNDFLLKPISKGELLVRIQAQLDMSASHKKLEGAVQSRTQALNGALNELSEQTKTLEQQKAKLEELYQWKTQFFINLSHEFRTPLSLLLGPLEDLLSRRAQGQDWLQEAPRMLRNGYRIVDHINQILDLAKIDADRLVLHYQQMDVVPLLKNCLASFKSTAESRNIRLRLDLEVTALSFGFDPQQLEKVIFNLLANAIGFSSKDSDVILGLAADDREVQIWVIDHGPGIKQEDQERIFDRYFQVNAQQTNGRKGSGIGLALSHELITLHSGVLKVDSEPDKGTTMQIVLPRITCENQEPSDSVQSHLHHKLATLYPFSRTQSSMETPDLSPNPQSIVLLEDDAELRAYLVQQLSSTYLVFETESGLQGLTLAREKVPDLVICDVCLPGIDGFEVCRELKRNEQTASIPVILLTGLTTRQHLYLGFEEGADDYITKPFHIKELKLRIHNLIQSRQQLKDHFIPLLLGIATPLEISPGQKTFIEKACQVLENQLAHVNFGTQLFADQLNFSRSKLHRQMVQALGLTPGDFIRRYRLQRAALLLRKGTLNISEVAYATGYREPNYFSKQFKEAFNIPPRRYQQLFGQTKSHGPSRYFSLTESSVPGSSVLN